MEFSPYKKLPPELKMKIWEQGSYKHGMHHFHISNNRFQAFVAGHPLHDQLLRVEPDSPRDRSVWKARNKAVLVDKFSLSVYKKLMTGPSAKVLYPLYPLPAYRARRGKAIVNVENDMICFKFSGLVTATWVRPLNAPDMFFGIKRIALEWKRQDTGVWVAPNPFRCRCPDLAHKNEFYCPKIVDEFITYFRDLEKLFFIIKVNQRGSILRPPRPDLARASKGDIKSDRQRRMTPVKKVHADMMKHIKETAFNERLAYFEDTKYEYFEAKVADLKKLVVYESVIKLFNGLNAEWEKQKKDANRPHPVHEVNLGVLVYCEKPKPTKKEEK
ncbi:hypothetical protein F5Y06DRAFT_305591 [Hypoxylon sp. FL0890]|nr:hypothetical protein F5Y06DRAFT_305591 [Hypoxylon sp. FL0890]